MDIFPECCSLGVISLLDLAITKSETIADFQVTKHFCETGALVLLPVSFCADRGKRIDKMLFFEIHAWNLISSDEITHT